jgi:phage shock protein C
MSLTCPVSDISTSLYTGRKKGKVISSSTKNRLRKDCTEGGAITLDKGKLRRSRTNKALLGVCGGISEFFGISAFWLRVLFIIFAPTSAFVYFILGVLIPYTSQDLY